MTQVRAITARAAQATFLLRKLVEGNLGRLALRLDDSWRSRLLALHLRSFICSPDGEAVAAQLISLLVTKHLSDSGRLSICCMVPDSFVAAPSLSRLIGAQSFEAHCSLPIMEQHHNHLHEPGSAARADTSLEGGFGSTPLQMLLIGALAVLLDLTASLLPQRC